MAAGRQTGKKKSSSSGRAGSKSSKTTKKTSAARGRTANSSKSRSGSKAKTGSKKSSERDICDEIMVLLIFAAAIIFFLSNFGLAGSIGVSIKWFMFGLIGVAQYIFPVIVLFTLLFLVSNKNLKGVANIKIAAVYILTVMLAAAWQRITNTPEIEDTTVLEFFTICADAKEGGGLLGGLICKLLVPLGSIGSMVIILIMAVICIVLITEKSFINGLYGVGKKGSRMVQAAKQDYDMYREHSGERFERESYDYDDYEDDEEYLRHRRQIKEEQYQEREEKRARQQAEKAARQAGKTARMDRKAERGITKDLDIKASLKRLQENNKNIEGDAELYVNEVENDITSGGEEIYAYSEAAPEAVENTAYMDNDYAAVEEEAENTDDLVVYIGKPDEYSEDASQNFAWENTEPESEELSEQMQQADETVSDCESKEQNAKELQNTGFEADEADKAVYKEYVFPPFNLLNKGKNITNGNTRENKETAMRLQQTLQNFGVKVTITDISCGPSVTRYELQPEQGVKVSKIVSLADDIKLSLAASDIRIEAPIPGKAAIGIEVPNKEIGSVSLRDLLETDTFKNNPSSIAFAAGKDIAGKTIVADIAKMPHLLIAGATGSGKSVCINTIIMSIIYKAKPEDVKMIMVDPKVVELSVYNGIPHLLTPVVTEPKKATAALNWAVAEMEARYKLFAKYSAREIKGFNEKIDKLELPEGEEKPEKMPQIVIIIDELADLMMVAAGEVEEAICRLAQLARAAGIHLVIATQRPSVNVITGLIKANVPSRIAFSVSSGVDSRTIIDMNGAEKLLGKGDMLFFPSGYPKPVRVQGAFVSDEEVGRVVDFLKDNVTEEIKYNEEVVTTAYSEQLQNARTAKDERDAYFADAGRLVIEKEKASISMLQRYFKIGFNRAGRIMEQLTEAKVVGPDLGTKPRKIEMTIDEFEAYLRENSDV